MVIYGNKEITMKEAFRLLNRYELTQEFQKVIQQARESTPLRGSAYSDDYDELIEAHNRRVFSKEEIWAQLTGQLQESISDNLLEEKLAGSAEVGDVYYLKVKLRNSIFDKKKKIYNGYERRPVLILSVTDSAVDGLELTHRTVFKGQDLIPIGRLDPADIRESYLNIYTSEDYKNLSLEYVFPYAFNKDGTPKTIYEWQLENFGKIRNCKDGNKPLLINFTSDKNYVTTLSEEKMREITRIVAEYEKNR